MKMLLTEITDNSIESEYENRKEISYKKSFKRSKANLSSNLSVQSFFQSERTFNASIIENSILQSYGGIDLNLFTAP